MVQKPVQGQHHLDRRPKRTEESEDDFLGDGEDAIVLDSDKKREGGEMGFLDHLEDLRMTIIKCVLSLMGGMMVTGLIFPWLFKILRYPLERAGAENALGEIKLMNTTAFGAFSVAFDVLIYGGIGLSLPFIAYFITQFIAPGLTKREKGLLKPALTSALVLFLFGATLCYFVLLPAALRIGLSLSQSLEFNTMLTAPEYFDLVTWFTLGTGVIFEFPLVLIALMAVGVVEASFMRNYRRHAFIIILIIAAIVTPSQDPVTLMFMAGPMYLLYEAAIIVGARIYRKRQVAEAAREAEER
jgi:sec-independent protein translocase protein TatC